MAVMCRVALFVATAVVTVEARNNISRTPPMGWSKSSQTTARPAQLSIAPLFGAKTQRRSEPEPEPEPSSKNHSPPDAVVSDSR